MNYSAKVKAELRERRFARFFWALYLISWVISQGSPALAAATFTASAFLFWVSVNSAPASANSSRGLWLFLIAILISPGLYVCWVRYNKDTDSRLFQAYLRQHVCKYDGEIVVGMSKGGCDRADNCEDPQEIEESQYLCATTRRRITFSQFRAGDYGHSDNE